jgi:flagellar protein FlaG
MNSEISNVVKISPVTVAKAEKQAEDRPHANVSKVVDGGLVVVANSVSENSENSVSLSKENEKRKNESKTDAETMRKAVDQGNTLLQAVRRNLQFKVDDATKATVIKIVDSDSGEVLRQIPSEEMLTFIKRMQELEGQQGSVIQDRA